MKNRISNATNETVKMHTSFAKTFFIIAGAALLFSLTVYVYYNFIRTESLKFYKDMDNCSVSLRTDTHRTRSGKRSKTRTSYYVYVTTPEGEQDLKMNVSRSYYDAMSLYNGKKDITLSFFKTKSGELFPSTIAGCSEKEAGRQYVKCYPPNMLNTVMLVIACIGGAFIGAGLLAMRTAKNYSGAAAVQKPADNTVSEEHNDEFMREFNEAMERDPFKRTRSPYSVRGNGVSGKEEKISWRERDKLMKEFDELTADGKYNYKSHN